MKFQASSKKTVIAQIGLLSLAAGLALVSLQSTFELKSLAKIQQGLRICFTRVNQTFTAKMINSGPSAYLDGDFMEFTGECTGEVSHELETLASDQKVTTRVNQLISATHYFHERVKRGVTSFTENQDESSMIMKGYQMVENSKDELETHVEAKMNRLQERIDQYSIGLLSSLGILALMLGLQFRSTTQYGRKNLELEGSALSLLEEKDFSPLRVEQVVRSALDAGDFANVSRLYIKSSTRMMDQLEGIPVQMGYVEDEYIERSQTNQPAIACNLDQTVADVVDILSEKIFTASILLDIQVSNEFNAVIDQEALSQTLYQLIQYSMRSFSEGQEVKKISLRAKALGGSVMLSLLHNGPQGKDEALELTLARELLKDYSAEMTKHTMNDSAGEKMTLILKRARKIAKSNDKKVTVIKGKKQDILEQLSGLNLQGNA